MSGDSSQPNPQHLRAIADPARMKLLELLNHRVASSAELAEESGISLERVEYHLEILTKSKCIRLAATKERGGEPTPFYTACEGIIPSLSRLGPPVKREAVTQDVMREFALRADTALHSGRNKDDTSSLFVFESLKLTVPHRAIALQALHLTVANLRTLHEQSRHLNIATDTPLLPVELGVALFKPVGCSR